MCSAYWAMGPLEPHLAAPQLLVRGTSQYLLQEWVLSWALTWRWAPSPDPSWLLAPLLFASSRNGI